MGRLLVVDPDDRAVLADLDSGARVLLGVEPSLPPGSGRIPMKTVVWSRAGQWAACAVDSGEVDGIQEVRIYEGGPKDMRVVAPAVAAFYLNPSPCGRYLSHLSPGPLGLELAVSDIASGELRVLERGQPLFWSWSPDASRIAVHVGDRATVISLDADTAELLTETAGPFQAPWWMPDGSIVFVADDQIVSQGPGRSVSPIADVPHVGRFAVDPDGRRLAFVDIVDDNASLVVLDLLTGQREVVSVEPVAAFFWSPEGRHLAALGLAGPGLLQWIVSDGREIVRLAPFRPGTRWLREVLPFFEQYAQSHAVWSADGTQLVAPAVAGDGSPEAVIQSIDEAAADQRVPGARLAWWATELIPARSTDQARPST
jgi:TolB protein